MLDQLATSTLKDVRDGTGAGKPKKIADFAHVAGMVKGFGNRLSQKFSRLSPPKSGPRPIASRIPRKF